MTKCEKCRDGRLEGAEGYCDECLSKILSSWSEHTSAPTSVANIRSYGITERQHVALFVRQRGVCAICRDPERSKKSNGGLVVDHDHGDGRVRALLCSRCNSAIGLMAENRDWLRKAAAYVQWTEGAAEGALRKKLEAIDERIERLSQNGPVPDGLLARRRRIAAQLGLTEVAAGETD